MLIRKAVIPAAGLGTRMLPAAKVVAKELLPVLDRPVIQYVVQEAAEAGISDVCLISSPEKRPVERHFARNESLEARLAAGGKEKLLSSVNELVRRVRVTAVDQIEQRGLGDAVSKARSFVGNEPFLCMLGDAVFSGDSPSKQLVEAHREFGTAVIGLEEVALEKVSRYGVVGGRMIREGVIKIETMVEKPAPQDAPSRLVVAARYVLVPEVFDCLEKVEPGAGGEIQLTDGLRMMLERGEKIHGVVLRGKRHDIGNPIDWLKTNIVFASRDPRVWKEIEPLLKSLVGE